MSDLKEDLENLAEAHAFYEDGMILLAGQKYQFALNQFKEAKGRYKNLDAQLQCLKAINHCKKRIKGIVDLRHFDCSIYIDNNRITKAQMDEVMNTGRYSSEVSTSKGRRGTKSGLSVKAVIAQLIKDNDGPDKIKYEEALEEARKADPDTKFNPMHWSYYKSIWKKEQKAKAK